MKSGTRTVQNTCEKGNPKPGRCKTLVKNGIRNPDGAKALGKNEIPILN